MYRQTALVGSELQAILIHSCDAGYENVTSSAHAVKTYKGIEV